MHTNHRRKNHPPVRASLRRPWENETKHGMKQAAWVKWRARERRALRHSLRLDPEAAAEALDRLPARMLRDIRFYGF